MKKYSALLIGLALIAGVLTANYAMGTPSPYPPWTNKAFPEINLGKLNRQTGNLSYKVAHAYYNFSVHGGATVGTAADLGVGLPPYSIITRSYYRVRTALTAPGIDAGGGTLVGVYCEDNPTTGAMNVIASALSSSFTSGKNGEGVSTGTVATYVEAISAACNLKLYTSTHALTAGAMDVFVEYVASAN